jgi:hypothetical protein
VYAKLVNTSNTQQQSSNEQQSFAFVTSDRDGKLITHNDAELEYFDAVSLTFEKQKKDEKIDTITQMASGEVKLCPVRAAATVRLPKYVHT